MKKILLLPALIFSLNVYSQEVIVNPDGTHSIQTGSVIVNPDGTHSTVHGNVIVNPNGTHSIKAGSIIVNPNGTHSISTSESRQSGADLDRYPFGIFSLFFPPKNKTKTPLETKFAEKEELKIDDPQ